MFSSIRWNILFWMALLLTTGIGGFGATLYYRVRQSTLNEVDADLLGAAQALAVSMQGGKATDLTIPDTYRHRFGMGPKDRPYLAVWNAAGELLTASENAPHDLRPEPEPPPQRGRHPFQSHDRGPNREVIINGPDGSQILVGRSVRKEWDRVAALLRWIVLSGTGILGLGLVGGWLISKRILAPVERISTTAEAISATNLSQRIDVAGTKSELGRLANVLNRMFGRLEFAFDRQGRFTADASHELRTPVSVILSQTETALARERPAEEYREALEACYRSSRRMKSLIDDLLLLTRADTGRLGIRSEPVDFQQITEDTVNLLQPLAEARRILVSLDLQSVKMTGDAERLGQVVCNLLTNAIQYNQDGGGVKLKLEAKDGLAVLTVSDTGLGIADEEQGKVFDRFYRADPSRSSSNHGSSGLGLAICQEIVRAHGGNIELASVAGQGTTVTVRIPHSAVIGDQVDNTTP